MKSTELMIGNWILYGEKPVQVLQLTSEKTYKGFYPIPLTPEILEKNGWTKASGYWVLKGYSTRLGWKNGEMIVGYSALPEKVLYVHELQNLMKVVKISCNFEI